MQEVPNNIQQPAQETPQGELPEATPQAVELEELQKQVEMYKDLLLRKAAEFENFKRRSEQEAEAIIKFANEKLLLELLPVVDDFERSLQHSKESADFDALVKGIELIYQKLLKVLESHGVKSFETVGKEFDVNYHDALMQVHKEGVPPHTILQEVEKGYMFHDKVLRHAKVVVSAASSNGTTEKGESA